MAGMSHGVPDPEFAGLTPEQLQDLLEHGARSAHYRTVPGAGSYCRTVPGAGSYCRVVPGSNATICRVMPGGIGSYCRTVPNQPGS